MSNINFKLDIGFTCIYNEFIDKYMVLSPIYSMVYIYAARLACQGIAADNKIIADKLNIFESDVVKAWQFWQEKGIVKINDGCIVLLSLNSSFDPQDIKPSKDIFYNPSVINKLSKNDKGVDQLIKTVEKIIGKPLSPNNLNILMNIYDKMGFTYDVIITLVQYYSDKPLSYIEKVAISWAEKGITTLEQAEGELNSYSVYSKIIRFFGVTNRNYTESEKKYMEIWIKEYKLPLDIIKTACERTVENTGKVSLSYANKILTSWHKNGVKTMADIEKLDLENQQKKTKTANIRPVKNVFNNYEQKKYTDEEINEILRRKANN